MHLQLLFVCLFAQDDRHYQVPFQELMVRISYTQMILYTSYYIRFRNIRFLYYLSFCLCKSNQRTLVVLCFLTHCGMFKTFWPNSFVFESECKGTHFLPIYQMFLNVFLKNNGFFFVFGQDFCAYGSQSRWYSLVQGWKAGCKGLTFGTRGKG